MTVILIKDAPQPQVNSFIVLLLIKVLPLLLLISLRLLLLMLSTIAPFFCVIFVVVFSVLHVDRSAKSTCSIGINVYLISSVSRSMRECVCLCAGVLGGHLPAGHAKKHTKFQLTVTMTSTPSTHTLANFKFRLPKHTQN